MPPDRLTVVALGDRDLSPEALRAVAAAERLLGAEPLLAATRHLVPPTVRTRPASAAPGALAAEAVSTDGQVTVLVEPAGAHELAVALADLAPDVPVTVLGVRR